LDLIVGRLSDGRLAGAVNEKILKDAGLSLVAGPHHVLAKRKRIRWTDVVDFPWVLSPMTALLRGPLERAFERNGLPMPANRIETSSVQVIRSYLQHSDALAVISDEVSQYYAALGVLAILPFDLPRLLGPIGVVWSRHRPLSSPAEELIACLEGAARTADVEHQPARKRRKPLAHKSSRRANAARVRAQT
jgi:DNA-binding transcriptional LysR family regulator